MLDDQIRKSVHGNAPLLSRKPAPFAVESLLGILHGFIHIVAGRGSQGREVEVFSILGTLETQRVALPFHPLCTRR